MHGIKEKSINPTGADQKNMYLPAWPPNLEVSCIYHLPTLYLAFIYHIVLASIDLLEKMKECDEAIAGHILSQK